ncbi:restriction endonuclease subunit S [Vibrio furnissii]
MTGRYKAYPEYKDSGVEWVNQIPTHWKFGQLSKLFEIKAGGDLKTEYFSPVLSESHPYPIYTNATDENAVYGYTSRAFYQGNSITVSGRGDVGYAIYRDKPFDAIIRLLILTPRSNICSKFFMYFIREVIDFQVESSAIGQLSTNQISPFKVVFPNFEEQQKIANFLDHETAKIDTLIAKQEKLIELLKEKRQAVISHAVTKGLNPDAPMKDSGVEWLGEVPEHWDMKRLKYIGEARNGLTYSPDDVVTQEEGILVLRSSNIQDARLSFSDNVYVNMDIPTRIRTKENDLLICSRNGSRQLIGKNALITKEAADMAFGAFMVVFRSKINPYLYWVLNSPLFDYQSGSFLTSTINQLTIGNLENMEIPLPPECEQEEIKNYLIKKSDYFDDLTSKALHKVNLLKERKTALISAAVTGKIDVRDWQPQGVQDE